MKKKNLSAKLSLNKKIIAPLTDIASGTLLGGSATCASMTGGCPTTNPTYDPTCTLGVCWVRHTDGCPTTSNMCPTSPEVNCTVVK